MARSPKSRPYMPWFVGDFLADTMHLNAEQIGAYSLLMMALWQAKGEIPDDERRLRTIARISRTRWPVVWAAINDYFTALPNGTITQLRVRRELGYHLGKAEAGRRGGLAKAAQRRSDRAAPVEAIPSRALANAWQHPKKGASKPPSRNLRESPTSLGKTEVGVANGVAKGVANAYPQPNPSLRREDPPKNTPPGGGQILPLRGREIAETARADAGRIARAWPWAGANAAKLERLLARVRSRDATVDVDAVLAGLQVAKETGWRDRGFNGRVTPSTFVRDRLYAKLIEDRDRALRRAQHAPRAAPASAITSTAAPLTANQFAELRAERAALRRQEAR